MRVPTVARRVDPFVIAAVALVARLPAYVSHAYPHPDDATYGMSVVMMRDGAVPFRDVFSSQGPLHLPLLYVGDLLGGRTSVSPRTMPLLAGVAAAVMALFVGRRLGGRAGGVLAGVVVALSGSLLWTTSPITSDGLSLALGLGGFWLALRYADRPSAGRAALAALPLAAAVLVKPATSAIGVLAALIVVGSRRRWRDLGVMAAVAVGLALASALPFGLGNVWDQTVRYQQQSDREATIGQNVSKITSTLWSRDLILLAVASLSVATVVTRRRRHTRSRDGSESAVATTDSLPSGTREIAIVALWVWVAVLLAFLVLEPALWRNHLANLVVPVALLAASARPSPRVLAGVLVVVVPFHLLFVRSILHPAPLRGASRQAVQAIAALPPGSRVITDEIGLVWRAGRSTPPDLVDASIKRFEQHRITEPGIARAARARDVCAVLVWRDQYLGSFPNLPRDLKHSGYVVTQRFKGAHGARVLYERLNACPAG
jgi:hypothetical protein